MKKLCISGFYGHQPVGKRKSHADKRRHTKESDLNVGDKMLVMKPVGFHKETYDPVP